MELLGLERLRLKIVQSDLQDEILAVGILVLVLHFLKQVQE